MFKNTSGYLENIFTSDNPEVWIHSQEEFQLNKSITSDKDTSFLKSKYKNYWQEQLRQSIRYRGTATANKSSHFEVVVFSINTKKSMFWPDHCILLLS